MKTLILIALTLTTAVSLQGQIVNKQYDKFEDRTRYWTSPAKVRDEYEHDLRVSGYFYYRGQGAGKLFSFLNHANGNISKTRR